MKNIKTVTLILGIMFVVGCSEMNELSDRFLDKGATIYAAKVDSAAANTGANQIEIIVYVKTERVDFVRIYWNNYGDSSDIKVGNTPGIYRKLISIPEPSLYLFNLVSFDAFGNKSLPYEVTGTVIGDDFIANLSQRRITAAYDNIFADGVLVLNIANKPSYALYSELFYTSTMGESKMIAIEQEAAYTINVDDFDKQGGLRIKTYYKANETAFEISVIENAVLIMEPVLSRTVEYGISDGNTAGTIITSETSPGGLIYQKIVSTNGDPSPYTNNIGEILKSSANYKVFYKIKYQTAQEITNGQLFYAMTGAAGGVSTNDDLYFAFTGLDPDDASRWQIFSLDCADAFTKHNWGSATNHRFRFDALGNNNDFTMYIHSMWFEIWILQ